MILKPGKARAVQRAARYHGGCCLRVRPDRSRSSIRRRSTSPDFSGLCRGVRMSVNANIPAPSATPPSRLPNDAPANPPKNTPTTPTALVDPRASWPPDWLAGLPDSSRCRARSNRSTQASPETTASAEIILVACEALAVSRNRSYRSASQSLSGWSRGNGLGQRWRAPPPEFDRTPVR